MQLRLVTRFLRLSLLKLGLVRPRIYLREKVAGFYVLALFKEYFIKLAVDTRFYCYRKKR